LSAPCFLLPGFGANLLNSKQGRDKSRADKYIVFACRSKARTKSRLTFLSWHVETLTKWTGKCWPIPKFRTQKLLCIDPVWTRNQPAWCCLQGSFHHWTCSSRCWCKNFNSWDTRLLGKRKSLAWGNTKHYITIYIYVYMYRLFKTRNHTAS